MCSFKFVPNRIRGRRKKLYMSYGLHMRIRTWPFFIVFVLHSCSMFNNSDKFDRNVWLSNGDVDDMRNPRSQMTTDLLNNYLKPGIHRDSILILLGTPYLEQIENRLPKGLDVPDSLSLVDSVNFRSENQAKALRNFNEWYKDNGQPDALMLYPVGWSTIDPIFLVIKFRPDSTAYEFWIEQH
jgi:hypothetical protein